MQMLSPFSLWFRTPRLRRALALGAVVLSTGGIVLLRSSATAQPRVFGSVADSSTRTSFSGPRLHGSVALSHGKILEHGGQVYADLTLAADKGSGSEVRAPVSLAIVLDTSGSMSGEKIEEAKRSAIRLVRDMRAEDEVAFIRYSDSSELVQSLARVSEVREGLIRRIEGITANGGTNIPSGLKLGKDALRNAAGDHVHRIVLMSDGLDSSKAEADRLAAAAAAEGTVTSSLGIGLDFDEGYMSSVASAGHGNFAFVKDGASLGAFLEKELTETAHTVVQNASVRIRIPSGLAFVRASGADARMEGGELVVRAGSLFGGDERRILLEFRGSGSNEPCEDCDGNRGNGTSDFVTAGTLRLPIMVDWNVVSGGSGHAEPSALTLTTTRDVDAVRQSMDPQVYSRAVSVLASRRQMEAAEAFSRGDHVRAGELAEQNTLALRAAASALPPPMAAPLAGQADQFLEDKKEFQKGLANDGAKAASKRTMQREFGNAYRNEWK